MPLVTKPYKKNISQETKDVDNSKEDNCHCHECDLFKRIGICYHVTRVFDTACVHEYEERG